MRRAIALTAIFCCSSVAAPRASIELLPDPRPRRETVTLGDLAHVRCDDLEMMRLLVNLPVGRVPAAGQSAVVRRDTLAAWVHRHTGFAAEQIAWAGSGEARLVRVAARLRGEEIAEAAESALRSWMSSRGVLSELQASPVPRDLEVPAGAVRMAARALEQVQLRRRTLVWVDVWAGERFVRTVPVSFDTAFRERTNSAEAEGSSPVLRPDRGQGQGESPEGGSLAVTRGDWAALRSGAGAVALESRVQVLQDGRLGQKVRVRQQGASGIVLGRVVGRGQLELAP